MMNSRDNGASLARWKECCGKITLDMEIIFKNGNRNYVKNGDVIEAGGSDVMWV